MILENTRLHRFVTYTMFFNRLYISLAIPFYIGFVVNMEGGVLIAEIISHSWSVAMFLLQFRVPVVT